LLNSKKKSFQKDSLVISSLIEPLYYSTFCSNSLAAKCHEIYWLT
jgi:hypothetical protein